MPTSGLRPLPDFTSYPQIARRPSGSEVQFPLSGDTTKALATYQRTYERSEEMTATLRVKAFNSDLTLRALGLYLQIKFCSPMNYGVATTTSCLPPPTETSAMGARHLTGLPQLSMQQ